MSPRLVTKDERFNEYVLRRETVWRTKPTMEAAGRIEL
jgi:hypothetical protein